MPSFLVAFLLLAGAAEAKQTIKKALFNAPITHPRTGKSMFPMYRSMGVGIYEMQLHWNGVAPSRPAKAKDPSDPAYRWPPEVDRAIREARRNGIKVALQPQYSPPWANGGRARNWAPKRDKDFARFMTAAARRYRAVRHWLIWAEPSRQAQFRPMSRYSSSGPRRYARLLDAAYGALKSVRRSNLVVGGNTFTTGDVPPQKFIRSMKLPGGKPPRMDLYGHNPFTKRAPDLGKPPLPYGYADFSDLDTLARWVDRHLSRKGQRHLRLFLSEFTIPTDHANREFNFWVTRETQADWLRRALRITRRWKRIYTLGWVHLFDERPTGPGGGHGNEVHGGLLDWRGRRKPSFYAYKRG
jgi:hypothetical protein